MTRALRVLLVHRGATVPSARIRMLALAPHLRAEGARVDLATYPVDRVAWKDLGPRIAESDVVVLQKKLPSLPDARRWRRIGRPLVFDFDDALPFRPRGRRVRSLTRARRFARVVDLADAVVAGNDALASLCGHPRKPLLIAPSPVAFPVPRRDERPPSAVPRIGWIGGGGNLESLRILEGPLARLARGHAFRLAVVSDAPHATSACEVENVPWSLAEQEREIARFDVGVMPLADTPWNRGKCAYKLLQYMAAGVPCVASPVGMNAQLVCDGKNGLLASSPEAWEASLARLLRDPALGDRLGRAGRATVEAEYGYPVAARRWLAFLRDVASAPPAAP